MTFRKLAGLTTVLLMMVAMLPLVGLGQANPSTECASADWNGDYWKVQVNNGDLAGIESNVGNSAINLSPDGSWTNNHDSPVFRIILKVGGGVGSDVIHEPPVNPIDLDTNGLSHVTFCFTEESTTTTTESTTTTEAETTTTTEAETTTTTEAETTTTTEAETTTTTEGTTTTTEEEVAGETTTTTEAETTTTTEAETTTTTTESTTTTEAETTTTTEAETTTTTEAETTTTTEGTTTTTEEEVAGETTSTTEAEVEEETTSTTEEDETEDTLPFTGIGTDGIALAALIALASGAGLIFLTGRSAESEIDG